ncbi:MAG: T9SS type A sorting domain-containing protein [Bacteroidota bacterium]
MKALFLCTFALFAAGTAPAQDEVVADTLDWRRYYPLQVGNTWEYGYLDSFISTIVRDTMANGHRYFVKQDSILPVGNSPTFVFTSYVRYDTAGTVVTLPSIEADTLDIPLPWGTLRANGTSDFLASFDMRTAFGDTVYYEPIPPSETDAFLQVTGGYGRRFEPVFGRASGEVAAIKCFRFSELLYTECYAADVGLYFSGNLYSAQLDYARVNGVEYGEQRGTPVESSEVPDALRIGSVYPNPFRDKATLTYHLDAPSALTIEIFNALGQQVWHEELPAQPSGTGQYTVRNPGWPAGLYLIRLSSEDGVQSVESMVIVE